MKRLPKLWAVLFGILIVTHAPKVWAVASSADTDALAAIQMVDQNEIQAAGEAEKKKLNPKVKDYAQMLHKEHTKNLDKANKLIDKLGVQTSGNATAQGLQAQGAKDLASLTPLDGDEFASVYLTAMINGHTQALSLLDTQSQSVQDEDVKKFVAETRGHVSMHLDRAKELQGAQGK
jgi:putative membrane protein